MGRPHSQIMPTGWTSWGGADLVEDLGVQRLAVQQRRLQHQGRDVLQWLRKPAYTYVRSATEGLADMVSSAVH